MNNMKKEQLRLYAVTDRTWLGNETLYEQVEKALEGGATLVQLREKELPEADVQKEAEELLELCHRYGVKLILDDDVELAAKVCADGVHIGQSDMELAHAREILGPDKIIGVTAKTVEQAKAAEAGVAGGTIMSLPPVSFRPDPERSQHWRDRLEHIMQYTSQTPGFHPFFWIDPTEADIFSQISTAVEAGVRGFKCICNHFAPKSCLKQFSAIAETGLPIHFHSVILFDHYA